jgi:hypothetical protein
VAIAEVSETLHQSPESFGLSRSRWWLDGIRQTVPWLAKVSLPGIWHLLSRFDLVYKRGRRYVHAPDPAYARKAAQIRVACEQVQRAPQRFVLLYQDELTYDRCPTVAQEYEQRGSHGPRVAQGSGYNSSRRIAGCLDASSGRLI